MSMDAVKATGAERRAQREREKQTHEAKLQRQILDWIEVVKPERGNILVLRVPEDLYAANSDVATPEQDQTMRGAMGVLQSLLNDLARMGTPMAGGTILRGDMRLEDAPPPEASPVAVPDRRILLPPGTKI